MIGFGADPVCGVTDDVCRQAPFVAFCRSTKTGKLVETYIYQARYHELSQIADKRQRHCEACRLAGGKMTCERAPQCETLMMAPTACPSVVAPWALSVMLPTKIAPAPGSQPYAPSLAPPGMEPQPLPQVQPVLPGGTVMPGWIPGGGGMQTLPGELPPEIAEAFAPTEAAAPGEPRPGEALAARKNWLAIAAIGAAVLGVGYLMMKKEKRS